MKTVNDSLVAIGFRGSALLSTHGSPSTPLIDQRDLISMRPKPHCDVSLQICRWTSKRYYCIALALTTELTRPSLAPLGNTGCNFQKAHFLLV